MPNRRTTRRHLLAAGIAIPSAIVTARLLAQAEERPADEASSGPHRLFAVTFERDWQPEGSAQGAFYRIVLPPDFDLTYLPGPYCGCSGERIREGTAAECVLAGEYVVRLDRPFIVRRADGTESEVAAEEEVTLAPGDTAIYPDALAFGSLRSATEEPVELVGASITSLDRDHGTFTPELPSDMSVRLSVANWDAWQTLGDGAIQAILTQWSLAAGSEEPPYEIDGLEAIYVAAGEIETSVIRPGQQDPLTDPLYVRTGGTVAFRKHTPGTQRILMNPFEAPAELLRLSFTRPD